MILQGFIVAYLDDTTEIIMAWFPNRGDADAYNANTRILGAFVAPRQAEFAKP